MPLKINKVSDKIWGFPGGSDVKNLPAKPGLGRSPGEGNGNPLQYSCLKNPHGWSSLAAWQSIGCKELDTTERLSTAQQDHQTSTSYTLRMTHC